MYVKLPKSPVPLPVILSARPLIWVSVERGHQLLTAAGRGDAVDRPLHVLTRRG